jgi:glycosyltransferase involved in cell wall biosynthesis
MMRVLHVVASLAPRHGGPTEAALQMVRALRAEGVDASILSSDDDVGNTLDVPLRTWIDHEGVPVQFLPRIKAKQHTLVGFTFTPGLASWLQRHVSEYDFIHVHTVFSFPANVAMNVARKQGVPYAVRPLGQLCRWSMGRRNLLKRAQLALFTRRNVNAAAFIHTTSRMEAVETTELGFASPCRVLPHGINMPPIVADARNGLRAELGIPDTRLLVVFMSRFHEKKGIELLLQACANLEDPVFDLVLAGTGDESYVAALKQRVTQAGLDARVHWFGFAAGDRKWRLLRGADLFVLPSYSENFGIAVLEALACGLPVIVSDQVALADEVARESLGRVVAVDPIPLTGAIGELLCAAGERAEIGRRAVRIAERRFSWPATARQLIEAYREAIPQTVGAK